MLFQDSKKMYLILILAVTLDVGTFDCLAINVD